MDRKTVQTIATATTSILVGTFLAKVGINVVSKGVADGMTLLADIIAVKE